MRERESNLGLTLSLIGFSAFVFWIWFSKGYAMPLTTDAMKEAVNMIDFRFPNMLFSDIAMTGDGIWHRSRWSADVLSYLSFHGLSKSIAFFTGDMVTALFIAQGAYIGFIFLALLWVLSLYGAAVFRWEVHSKGFFLLLFAIAFSLIFLYFPSPLPSQLFIIRALPPFFSNYIWTLPLILGALFPHWCILFDYPLPTHIQSPQILWSLLILCAAFSSIGATVLYGFSLFIFSLGIIIKKRSFLVFWHSLGIGTLFAGICILTSITAEALGGRDSSTSIQLSSANLKLFLKLAAVYSFAFLVVNVVPLLFLFIRKAKESAQLLKASFFFALIGGSHLMLLILIAIGGRGPNGLYLSPSNIMFLMTSALIWTAFIYNLPSKHVHALFIFTLLSYFISFMGYFPPMRKEDYRMHLYLYQFQEINKSKTIPIQPVEIDISHIEVKQGIDAWGADFYFNIIKNFCYSVGIVDQNREIKMISTQEP